jgi:hypothetical protein
MNRVDVCNLIVSIVNAAARRYSSLKSETPLAKAYLRLHGSAQGLSTSIPGLSTDQLENRYLTLDKTFIVMEQEYKDMESLGLLELINPPLQEVTKIKKSEIKVSLPKNDGQATFKLSRGGARGGAGRKKLGITTKVSVTLEQEDWDFIDEYVKFDQAVNSRSAFFRQLYLMAYHPNSQRTMEFSIKPAKAEKSAKKEKKKEIAQAAAPATFPTTITNEFNYQPVSYKEDYFFNEPIKVRDYKKVKCYFCDCALIKSAKTKDQYTWENHKAFTSDPHRFMYYCFDPAGECAKQAADYRTNLRMQEMLEFEEKSKATRKANYDEMSQYGDMG